MCHYKWIQWLDSVVVWYRCGTIVLPEILNYEDVLGKYPTSGVWRGQIRASLSISKTQPSPFGRSCSVNGLEFCTQNLGKMGFYQRWLFR